MTATSPSVFAPGAATRSWTSAQRVVVLLLVALFIAVAFTVGRVTAPTHRNVSVIAPAAVSLPAGAAGDSVQCRVGPC